MISIIDQFGTDPRSVSRRAARSHQPQSLPTNPSPSFSKKHCSDSASASLTRSHEPTQITRTANPKIILFRSITHAFPFPSKTLASSASNRGAAIFGGCTCSSTNSVRSSDNDSAVRKLSDDIPATIQKRKQRLLIHDSSLKRRRERRADAVG